MKRILVLLVLITSFSFVNGQRSVDALFGKYADKDGFVTIQLTGDLLKFVASHDDRDEDQWMGKITEIRILTQEDEAVPVENFYEYVMKDLNLNDYEEFMSVKKSDQDLRMLVRADGNVIKEFLLIGGGEDNLIIQIKGKMTYKDAENFSSQVKNDHGRDKLTILN
jgi:hypothetical protein